MKTSRANTSTMLRSLDEVLSEKNVLQRVSAELAKHDDLLLKG
jgi:hypothetical protein